MTHPRSAYKHTNASIHPVCHDEIALSFVYYDLPPRSSDELLPLVNDSPHKPPRRPRYQGKNPRQFDEKYKELQPEKYAEDVAKVTASGKTPAGTHRPIMVAEIMEVLQPRPGETAVDCTLGYGGHSRELLQAVQPGGRLIGLDADPIELPKTEQRLRAMGFPAEALVITRTNFAGLSKTLAEHAPEGADVLLADLGLSSMQIDDPTRGFSFKQDGPLDMRMNPQRGLSAEEWLKKVSVADLAGALSENADEPQAVLLAKAIIHAQSQYPLTTTLDLAELIRRAITRFSTEATTATIQRVFQAIRIAVNDEFEVLDALLRQLPQCLKPGGRVAILTFHSGEDRRVKHAFKQGLASGVYSRVAPDVTRASSDEQHANPRSSPAKLRWAIREA